MRFLHAIQLRLIVPSEVELSSRSNWQLFTQFVSYSAVACVLVALAVSQSYGQFLPDPFPIDSFEAPTGVDRWVVETENSIYVDHGISTTGVTRGSQSLALELSDGSGWGISLVVDETTNNTDLYNAFNTVAADPGAWNLKFDFTTDATSFANVSDPTSPPFDGLYQFAVAMNSDSGFSQTGGVSGQVYNTEVQIPISVPMSNLNPQLDSSAYQLFLGSSNTFSDGPNGEGAIAYIDNLRFTPTPPSVPQTIYSFEGSDQGWTDEGLGGPEGNHSRAHLHTLIPNSPAATHGTDTLQIDNTIQDPSFEVTPGVMGRGFGFYWGSNVTMNADPDENGEVEPVDQPVKDQISELAGLINEASAFAFDVHFNDTFDATNFLAPSPSFVRFALHVSDDQGTFFDSEGPVLAGTPDPNPDDTVEYMIPTSIMGDASDNDLGTLAEAGVNADTNFLRLGLAINSDGGILAEFDNFRLIVPVDLNADFDNDGDVDDDDLTSWEAAYGTDDGADADGDGDSDGADFLVWQREFGNSAVQEISIDSSLFSIASSTAVPEPSTVLLLTVALMAGTCGCRNRRNVL